MHWRFACAKCAHKVCMLLGTHTKYNLHGNGPKPTTPGTDGVAFWHRYSWLERKRWKQKADRCAALFFAYLCRSDIKMFKLKATALLVFFFLFSFGMPLTKAQLHHSYCWGLLNEKLHLLFYCVIYLRVSAGQCFSFLCSLSAQRRRSKINALMMAHCCTMAMIDPTAVAMAIRRQLMVVGLTTGSVSGRYHVHVV